MTIEDEFIRRADAVRFSLGRLLANAEVLGDSMDAPVRLREIQSVELDSMWAFIHHYDAARP